MFLHIHLKYFLSKFPAHKIPNRSITFFSNQPFCRMKFPWSGRQTVEDKATLSNVAQKAILRHIFILSHCSVHVLFFVCWASTRKLWFIGIVFRMGLKTPSAPLSFFNIYQQEVCIQFTGLLLAFNYVFDMLYLCLSRNIHIWILEECTSYLCKSYLVFLTDVYIYTFDGSNT